MNAAPPSPQANIMVVEDFSTNLEILANLLKEQGYRVRPTMSGELAVQAALLAPPDLFLLDINLPGMNGYEVCRELKSVEKLRDIPIIFVSARNAIVDKLEGFKLGAVDYVTVPFEFSELEARVRAHLELAALRRELKKHNVLLEEKVVQRTHELEEAHARLAILDRAKGDFLHLISHELRTPITGILGVTDLLFQLAGQNAALCKYAALYEQSRRRLLAMVDDSLLLVHLGAGMAINVQEVCPLYDVLVAASSQVAGLAQARHVQLDPVAMGPELVQGASKYLIRAIRSLLETAVKFAQAGTTVQIARVNSPSAVCLLIEAGGLDIPCEMLPRFFDLLAIKEALTPGGDLGVALPLAERIISLCGGGVSVENLAPPGIRFTVRLRQAAA